MNNTVCEKMNGYLANIGVMYIKLHNFHWNVIGADFKPVHEYLETLYDGFADSLDAVAENIKMKGEMPLASMKEYLEAANIEEACSDKEYRSKEVLEIVGSDIRLLKSMAEDVRKSATETDDYGVISMMEEHLGHYDKTLWFIDSMLK